MKRFYFLSLLFVSLTCSAQFTTGNLLVYRIGDGGAALNTASQGNPVFLDEYTTGGVLVQSIPMPTANGGGNLSLVSGTSLPEGLMSRSVDGRFIIIPGHNATVGGNLSAADKVVGRINYSEDLNITTTFIPGSGVISSAASDDGDNIWSMAGGNGIYYGTYGSSSSMAITSNYSTGVRDVKVFGDQLYASTANSIAAIGSGKPQSGTNSFNNLPGITGNFYQFAMFDMEASVPGPDVLYVALQYGGVSKYSLVAGTWVFNGTVSATQYSVGLTGVAETGNVVLYAVNNANFTGGGGGTIQTVTDVSGYNGTFSGSFATLVTAAANTTFRGIVFTPTQFILPVHFENISAAMQADDIQLKWKVGGTVEPVQYQVERGGDGRVFNRIGSFSAAGTVHQFIDEAPLNGHNFYRIRSVDYDGKVTYSSIVRIHTGRLSHHITLFPSPVRGSFITLQMEGLPAGKYSYQLLNVTGQLMNRGVIEHDGGSSAHSINILGLRPGMFVLKLDGELNWSRRFVVR